MLSDPCHRGSAHGLASRFVRSPRPATSASPRPLPHSAQGGYGGSPREEARAAAAGIGEGPVAGPSLRKRGAGGGPRSGAAGEGDRAPVGLAVRCNRVAAQRVRGVTYGACSPLDEQYTVRCRGIRRRFACRTEYVRNLGRP